MRVARLVLVLSIVLAYGRGFATSDAEILMDASGDRGDRLEAKVNELQQKLNLAISQNKTLHSQILQLEESVRELSGKSQSIEHQNSTISGKLQNLTVDTNTRLEVLEKQPKQNANPLSPTKDPTAPLSKYLSMIEQQKYQQAISGLQKYIDDNPKSTILGEAYYWLGYANMSKGAYAQAIKLFMKSYNGFPKSSKAEYSLLNMGISLERLNEHQKACSILQKLISTANNKQVQSLAKHEAKNFLCAPSKEKPSAESSTPSLKKTNISPEAPKYPAPKSPQDKGL